VIAHAVEVARNPAARMVGLLNRFTFHSGEALIITKCRSIHMLFMRFPIDVIFADKHNRVVGLVKGIKPFGLSKTYWNASYCIELPKGMIAKTNTQIGDQLQVPPFK